MACLGRNAGTQFDPAVVEALTRVLARAGDVGSAPAAATSAA
jgi:HD-GYP domain-containing protein (c-di-GMP phosphodiesterase class II)